MCKIETLKLPEGYEVYEKSIDTFEGKVFALVKDERTREKYLYIEGEGHPGFIDGEKIKGGLLFPKNVENAYKLSEIFPYLKARPLGIGEPSFGFGDRLGIATAGHVRALGNRKVRPIFAQQSIREMERTKRGPKEVMADAIWGVFQEGYRDGFGSDADHLKTEEHVKNLADAGFTMFTCDPSDHVNNNVGRMDNTQIKEAFSKLEGGDALLAKYEGKKVKIASEEIVFDYEPLIKAIVKYKKAIDHTERMYNFAKSYVKGTFDFELSIDETDEPTSPLEHLFIASELKERGIKITGLAPRFVGDFQKAIDYIGDLSRFEEEFRLHIEIAKMYGPYKISVHSGSDKFSIYPIVGKYGEGLFHVKTAGTSYLEALRVIAVHNPKLFAEIYTFSLDRFEEDRATYHLTTDLSRVPDINILSEDEYIRLLDENDPRQVLHVTYGSVLTVKSDDGKYLFRDRFFDTLKIFEDEYIKVLVKHFEKHLNPLEG